MRRFKHSGTLGDIIYSLPIMKYLGGGEFHLHLGQVDWIANYYYKTTAPEYQRGKMDQKDAEFIRRFFEYQSYISKFDTLDVKRTEITHNLDRFRPVFVGHPTNYINIYCQVFGINDPTVQKQIINTPWLEVPEPIHIDNRPIVINRTSRGWTPQEKNPLWDLWRLEQMGQKSIFIGLPNEYEEFKKFSGWNLAYQPVTDMMEMAQIIAGAELFIGNQSVALSIAQGLRVPYRFERRRDLPLERNESYFPTHENGETF